MVHLSVQVPFMGQQRRDRIKRIHRRHDSRSSSTGRVTVYPSLVPGVDGKRQLKTNKKYVLKATYSNRKNILSRQYIKIIFRKNNMIRTEIADKSLIYQIQVLRTNKYTQSKANELNHGNEKRKICFKGNILSFKQGNRKIYFQGSIFIHTRKII